LRELALRRTAQRVDDQMIGYMAAHAIEGPWAASERLLVCLDEHSGSTALIRHARRLADRLHASWTAIFVETPRVQRLSEAARDRIAETLRRAERLGGRAVTVPAEDAAEAILDYAHSHNFTHIIVAKSRRSPIGELFHKSVTGALIRRAKGISIHVVPLEWIARTPGESGGVAAPRKEFRPSSYAGALALVIAAFGIALLLRHVLDVSSLALVFLTGVLLSTIAYGLGPGLFACVASVLVYNFFFLPPLYTFVITDPENVVTLFFFAAVAVIASNLTARVRSQAMFARSRARMTEDLYLFSRKLAGVVNLDDLLWATSYHIAGMLKLRVVLLLPEDGTVTVRAGYPPEDMLDDADLAAAKWAFEHGMPAGRGADTLPGAKRLFLPLRTARGTVGIAGLDSDRPGPLLTPDQRRLFDALADQAAIAIERINLAQDIDKARIAAETERLRSALLTSISHDLRTPLASILGSATTLRTYRPELDEAAEQDLIRTIQEEAERLNQFISDLLDMTRLESGTIKPRAEPIDVGDVVGSALRRAGKLLEQHRVTLDVPPALPMARGDPVLLEQVLFNLIDNAAKYSRPHTEIGISAAAEDGHMSLLVRDQGEGIPEADLERIFDKFYRVAEVDHRRAGTGLGLAICRGFVEAMGGTISAANRKDASGAIFTVTLPLYAEEKRVPETAQ
jgi:two-component system sensor histidine kinase KdpD